MARSAGLYIATAEATYIGGGAGNVSRLDFTGLDGDADGIYHMQFRMKFSAGSNMTIQFNDSSAGDAKRHTINSSTGAYTSTVVMSGSTNDTIEGSIVVNAERVLGGVARNRQYRCSGNWRDISATQPWVRHWRGVWENKVDNITKISIVGNIKEQSWVRLYRYPRAPL